MINKHSNKLAKQNNEQKEGNGKIAKKTDLENIKKEGVVVDSAFEFLFEGKNKEYDEKYKDYI
jgi:hypothetical protein